MAHVAAVLAHVALVLVHILAVGTQVALVLADVLALGARAGLIARFLVLHHLPAIAADVALVLADIAAVVADVALVLANVLAIVADVRRLGERAARREDCEGACEAGHLLEHLLPPFWVGKRGSAAASINVQNGALVIDSLFQIVMRP